jgi:hypothetical protein
MALALAGCSLTSGAASLARSIDASSCACGVRASVPIVPAMRDWGGRAAGDRSPGQLTIRDANRGVRSSMRLSPIA